jgi:hypothetical protein
MLTPYPAINRIELVVMIRDRRGVLGNLGDDHAITVQRRQSVKPLNITGATGSPANATALV